MAAIIINENTKIGKNILEMIKTLSKVDKNHAIRFLDETEFLLSTKANKEALLQGIEQVNKGENGNTLKPEELWK